MNNSRSERPKKTVSSNTESFLASSLGIVLVVCIAIGLGIGLYLDRVFHTAPVLTLIFLVIGIAAGFWQIIKEIIRLNASNDKKSHL